MEFACARDSKLILFLFVYSMLDDNFLSLFQQGRGDPALISQFLEKNNCKIDPEEEGNFFLRYMIFLLNRPNGGSNSM